MLGQQLEAGVVMAVLATNQQATRGAGAKKLTDCGLRGQLAGLDSSRAVRAMPITQCVFFDMVKCNNVRSNTAKY